jgi:hypothetical protein
MTDSNEKEHDSSQPGGARILDDNGTLVSDAGSESGAPAYVDQGNIPEDDDSGGGLGGTDAGSPGGMGGSSASGGTGNGRPPGGISPVQIERETRGEVDPDDRA